MRGQMRYNLLDENVRWSVPAHGHLCNAGARQPRLEVMWVDCCRTAMCACSDGDVPHALPAKPCSAYTRIATPLAGPRDQSAKRPGDSGVLMALTARHQLVHGRGDSSTLSQSKFRSTYTLERATALPTPTYSHTQIVAHQVLVPSPSRRLQAQRESCPRGRPGRR